MPYEKFKEHTIKIAKGEYKPSKYEPKIWFESFEAMSRLLNRERKSTDEYPK